MLEDTDSGQKNPSLNENQNQPDKKALEFIIQVGETMLLNGAEIYRIQETMISIAKAFQVETFHVFVIANGLFASVDEHGETHSTGVRQLPLSPIHLGRVVEINELSREISQGKLSVAQAQQRLEQIKKIPYASFLGQLVGTGFGAACFCYIFGGTFLDCIASLVSGIFLCCLQFFLGKKKQSKIVTNLVCSAFVTFLGVLHVELFPLLNLDKVIIGSIIPLVPGVPLTMSIRDYLNADYLSGTIRLIDTLLVAFCIAAGVGLVLKLAQGLLGVAL